MFALKKKKKVRDKVNLIMLGYFFLYFTCVAYYNSNATAVLAHFLWVLLTDSLLTASGLSTIALTI